MAPYVLPPHAVWFITGCSSGIGLALAAYLSTQTSSRVVATARNPSSLSSLPDTPNVLKLALDVTSEASIQAALATTLAQFFRIDVLVNNAGFNILQAGETVPIEDARNLMDTNFWGAVRLTQLVLPVMRTTNAEHGGKRGGVILQVSSMGGRLAFPGNSFYHASKFAMEGFTEALSKEVDPSWGIHFSLIEPGGVQTNYAKRSIETPAAKGKAQEESNNDPYTSNPDCLINHMKAVHEDPEMLRDWADASVVAATIFRIVDKGVGEKGEIPLRVPLGADSWGCQKKGLEVALQRLEDTRVVAFSTSKDPEAQLLKFVELLEL